MCEHATTDWHFGSLPLGAVMNSTAMKFWICLWVNIGVHFFGFIFLGKEFLLYIFHFTRFCQIVSRVVVPIYTPISSI